MLDSPTAGEAGGIFAGIVALLVTLGHGLKWLLGWEDKRAATRSAKLDAWQTELTARERAFDASQAEHWGKVERELADLRSRDTQRASEFASLLIEHKALRTAHQLISSALRNIDHDNPALGQAEEILRVAFPPDVFLPASLSAAAAKLDRID